MKSLFISIPLTLFLLHLTAQETKYPGGQAPMKPAMTEYM